MAERGMPGGNAESIELGDARLFSPERRWGQAGDTTPFCESLVLAISHGPRRQSHLISALFKH